MLSRLVVLGIVASASVASAAAVEGTVYVDEDRDGLFDAGEPPVAGIAVALEGGAFVKTDALGRYHIDFVRDGIVWVRTPDGYEPAPVFHPLLLKDGASQTVDLGLKRSAVTGNVTFLHASDSHVGNGIDLADVRVSFELAGQVEPRPAFLVVTGDIVHGATEKEFRDVLTVLEGVDVPFVPVPGNHDYYDNGVAYRKILGPTQYCFDQGGMRFIVLDFALLGDMNSTFAFIDRCTAERGGMPVAAFVHAPLDDSYADMLAAHGISYLFTGHWHSNRLIEHGTMLEINTETFVNGGIDMTPAGYRLMTFDGTRLHASHRTVVEEPVLNVIWPAAAGCAPPGPLEVIVAAENGATLGPLVVSLDGGAALPLVQRVGWTRTAVVGPLAAGTSHELTVSGAHGESATRRFCVETPPRAPTLAPWLQLQGSATHNGVAAMTIEPPLTHLWARSVGGHLRGGSPVADAGRIFVPVVDLGDGVAGGVVALDASTGAILWEKRVGFAVNGAPAIVRDLVVFGASNGMVHAVKAATGEDAWSYDLGTGYSQNYSWLYASPTVADDVVYIGTARRFSALDAATGRELWAVDPSPHSFWLQSYSSAGVANGVVIAAFSRGADGVAGWDVANGAELWRVPPPLASAVNASIVIDGNEAFIGNAATTVYSLDVLKPVGPKWSNWDNNLHGTDDNWAYGIMGTPALSAGKLVVPTMRGSVVALDRHSGAELWRHDGEPANLRAVHGLGAGRAAFAGSPVITGGLVWVGGADGELVALDLESGKAVWGVDLGAPILSGVIPAGDLLVVSTYDGTVHALIKDVAAMCPNAPGCKPPIEEASDCGCRVGTSGTSRSLGSLLLVAALTAAIRRRRRNS